MSDANANTGGERGSSTVTVAGIKLYNFCKLNIGSYSRRELRDFFLNGNIYVNGVRIRKGHDDETMRLSIDDVVCINIVDEPTIVTHIGPNKLDLVHESMSGFCVFNKPTGCSVTDGKEYEVSIRGQMWSGKFADTSTLLFRLEKSIGGLSIAVQSHEVLVKLRRALVTQTSCSSPPLTLTYQVLVCGWLGEKGDTVTFNTNYPDCPTLTASIVQHCRCRSADFLSLVNITPEFTAHAMGLDSIDSYQLFESDATPGVDKSEWQTESFIRTLENPVTNADYKMLNHPTRMLKAVRCALMRAGHGIVGDRDLVKKSKGLYAALTAVHLRGSEHSAGASSNLSTSDDLLLKIPTPAKFLKLMEREEKMWLAAHDRDQAVLAEHRRRVGAASVLDANTPHCSAGSADDDISEPEQNQDELDGSDSDEDGDTRALVSKTGALHLSGAGAAGTDVPVEYLTGEAMFCGRRFQVSNAVMIPRRSSEALVREAVRVVRDDRALTEGAARGVRVLDLGTGSGCLLLSAVLNVREALSEIPICADAVVSGVGLDISTDALKIAATNISKFGLSEQVTLTEGSFETMLETLSQHNSAQTTQPDAVKRKSFDIILCNPPYSSFKDKSRLSVACRKHEPAVALFAPRHSRVDVEGGTESGTMGAYYMIARSLTAIHIHDEALRSAHIEKNGVVEESLVSVGAYLIVEMGHGQETDVRRILSTGAQGWRYLHSVKDHLEIVRCLVFQYGGDDVSNSEV